MRRSGFISIELLIFIVIVGLLVLTILLALFFAQSSARDKQRMRDVIAMQTALRVYFTENGFYPPGMGTQMPENITGYLDRWPLAPAASGSCTASQNRYVYSQKSSGLDYTLTFCLGQKTAGVSAGMHTLTSKGIQ
jgi:type II secretory pathway pseudopilin PulG